MQPPESAPRGDTMPPEGTPQRDDLRRRVDKLLSDLTEFAELQLHPLRTRPALDEGSALLCLDCQAIFESTGGDGDSTRRNECPRCTSRANTRFTCKPIAAVDLPAARTEEPT